MGMFKDMLKLTKQATEQLQQIQQAQAPRSAGLAVGAELPIKVDRSDPARIAIDWDAMSKPPERGEIRPA